MFNDRGGVVSEGDLEHVRSAKRDLSQQLLLGRAHRAMRPFGARSAAPTDNVVGIGIGERVAQGRPTGELAIKLFVRTKYPADELESEHLLPTEHAGVSTDVEEIGLLRPLSMTAPRPLTAPAINPRTRIRPAQPGSSVGFADPQHKFVMAGTFGALVRDLHGQYVLSNNHVLADENQLPVGSPIYQPGLLDGGKTATDQIARLTRFIPIQTSVPMSVDCAIAEVLNPADVSNAILRIGPPQGTQPAAIDMVVHKFGRTSSYSVGRVSSIDTDVTVGYEMGQVTFQGQMIIQSLTGTAAPFSKAGDSGSLIVDRQSRAAVGLLFAGSDTHTIANQINEVLQALSVSLA